MLSANSISLTANNRQSDTVCMDDFGLCDDLLSSSDFDPHSDQVETRFLLFPIDIDPCENKPTAIDAVL